MYRFAYSAICQEQPSPAPPPSNFHKLQDAIELIEAADKAPLPSPERLQLLSEFRRLWLEIANGLTGAGRALSAEPPANMLPVVQSVLQEIERRRFERGGHIHAASNPLSPELPL